MDEILSQKRGCLWAINWNLRRPDKEYLIVYCECGRYSEIKVEHFLNDLICCNYCFKKRSDFGNKYRESEYEDQMFGKLRVLFRVENYGKNQRFQCKCICGQEKIFMLPNLLSGVSKHCGCLKRFRQKVKK